MALRPRCPTASTLPWKAVGLGFGLAAVACADERPVGARVESPRGLDAALPAASESGADAALPAASESGPDAALPAARESGPDVAPPGPNAGSAPSLRLVGRMDLGDAAGPRFSWSGAGVIAAFTGSSVTLSLSDSGQNQFTVLIDGVLGPTLVTQAGPQAYELARDLPAGEHLVEVYRRSEPSFGVTQLLGLDVGASGALLAPPRVTRRIELIGDSVSTGYGNEGADPTCGFSADTQNHYATYGAITARALGAELSTIAWSGKGVVYNYDTDRVEPMPALYGRTLPQEPESTYGFSPAPDAVVINLGTNDFSTDGDPEEALFAAEYAALLGRVRAAYPAAFISCTVGPLLNGSDLTAARAAIAAGVATFEAAGGGNVRVWEMNVPNADPGCDYHPGLATHQAMADALTAELRPLFP